MADNFTYEDANGVERIVRTTEVTTIHHVHHVMETLEDGAPTAISKSSPMPVSSSETDAAIGLVAGRRYVNKAGRNGDVDSGSLPEDIWNGGGVYTGFPTSGSAETISVVSTSADDAAAGTGARTVRLLGLDGSYNEITEDVTLNGTTPVNTVATFWRLHSASVQSAGAGGFNVGTITFRHTTTTSNVFLSMPALRNQSNAGAYTIPAGYTGLFKRLGVWIRSANTTLSADGEIWIRQFGAAARLRRPWSANNTFSYQSDVYGGIVLPEKTDIIIRVSQCSTNNMDIIAEYDLELIAN